MRIVHIPPDFPDSLNWHQTDFMPDCCRLCKHHPVNGGSDECYCDKPEIKQLHLMDDNGVYYIYG